MKKIWSFLTSVKLAIVLGGAILVASLAATFLRQEKAYATIYHAWWFLALLGAFAVNLIACAVNRARFLKPATLGSFVSHVGALTILAGAAVGGLWGVEGRTAEGLQEGQPIDRFAARGKKDPVPLPFQLVLKKFSLELDPPRLWLFQEQRGSPASWSPHLARRGDRISTHDGRFRFTVTRTFENHQRREEVAERSGELRNPALRMRILDSKGAPLYDGWLAAGKDALVQAPCGDDHGSHGNGAHAFKIVYAGGGGFALPDDAAPERLFVRVRDQNVARPFPVEPGATLRVCDGYALTIQTVTPDFSRRQQANHKQLAPVNPAVEVLIRGPEGDERRWVFAKTEFTDSHEVKYRNVALMYLRPPAATPVAATIRTVHNGAGYAHEIGTSDGASAELVVGRPIPLQKGEFSLALDKFCPDAAFTKTEVDAGGGLLAPAVQVRIQGQGRDETITLRNGEDFAVDPGEVALAYGYQQGYDGDIKNFVSKVDVVKDGKVVASRAVSLNNPLIYKGYRIYQNAYRAKNSQQWQPDLLIVRDPGVPVIYVGFVLLGLGLVYASFVRPFLKRASE